MASVAGFRLPLDREKGNKMKKEITKILAGQAAKGVTRWQVVCSFIHAGLTERQIGGVLDIDPRTVHSMKMRPTPRVIKNYLILNAAAKAHFINMIKKEV